MVYQAVTVLCLAILIVEVLSALLYGVLEKRQERIAYIRSFKKGKCAFIYLITIPLYLIGHYYVEQDFLQAFFQAVSQTVNLVVLKYDTGSITALMADSGLYRFTVYFAFVLAGINALLFTFSLTYQRIWCFFEAAKAMIRRRDKLYLFGFNDGNCSIFKSDTAHSKAIVGKMSDEQKEQLFLEEIAFIDTQSYASFLDKAFRRIETDDKTYTLIVNTENDEENMAICRLVIDRIASAKMKEQLFGRLRVFVFGDPLYASIYEDIVSDGFGCIHYFNPYSKVAVDFVDKYPLAGFLNDSQLDTETSLIKAGVDINVLMVGFGRTNHQIFMTSVANNQFLWEEDGQVVLKPVVYHIFDPLGSAHDKNLNHSYYRYARECEGVDPADYLPLPAQPAEEHYYDFGIDHKDFYATVRRILTKHTKDANFIIIDFGTDLENIDAAQKLVEKRGEWNLPDLKIFVKVSQFNRSQSTLSDKGCYIFGCEKEIIFDIDAILEDKMTAMAKMRNQIYDLEYTITQHPEQKIDEAYMQAQKQKSEKGWYMKKSQMERDSSIYGCLSLRSKLLLMGLDYAPESDPRKEISEKEYMEIYAKEDRPRLLPTNETAGGKPIVAYDLDFKASRRKTMAIHEHERWNSFMISRGMVPSTIEQILKETKADGSYTNGKNYAVRRHGNLTTFEGLEAFRKMVAERDGRTELATDVIKYDYQLLDDAYWLLNHCGYKIVRK